MSLGTQDDKIFSDIKVNIKKARKYAELSKEYETKVFNMLDDIGANTESYKTNAENASNLQEAICCYINYDEYSLEGLMEEIRNAAQ